MTTTTPTTPLTDAEIATLDGLLLRHDDKGMTVVYGSRAAAEILALRAALKALEAVVTVLDNQREDLLAALTNLVNKTFSAGTEQSYHYAGVLRIDNFRDSCPFCIARAAIARAEGRAER